MFKNTIIALVAVAGIAGVAVPTFAAPPPVVDDSSATSIFGTGSPEFRAWRADTIVAQLQHQGVNATDVEEWGGLIRAYVTLEDGRQVMQYFAPGSLNPVAL